MTVTSTTIDNIIIKIGSVYPIRVGSETVDARGDGSLAWAETTGNGYVQILTDKDTAVQAGIMNVGDAVGYFKFTSAIPDGSKIQISHQSEWYEMMGDPIIPHISGNQLFKELRLRKVLA